MDKQRNIDTVPGGVSVKKEETKEIFLTTEKEITDFIEKAESLGFSQLRIPAGTSLKGDFSSQVSRFKWHENDFYLLLVPYDRFAHKRVLKTKKKKEKPAGETPVETAKRELLEETRLEGLEMIEIFRDEDGGKVEDRSVDEDKKAFVDYDKHFVHRFFCVTVKGHVAFFPDFRNPDDPETGLPVYVNIKYLKMGVKRKRGHFEKVEQVLYFGHEDTVRIGIKKLQSLFRFETEEQMLALMNLEILRPKQ